MKNNLMFFTLVLWGIFCISPVNAQSKSELGLRFGLGVSSLVGDVSGAKSTFGYGGSILYRYSLSPQMSIQPELQLTQKGAQGQDSDDSERLKLSYLEFPILLMYRPPSKSAVRPNFFAGPCISLLHNAKIGNEEVTNDMNKTDLEVVFGAGIDIQSSKEGRFSIDARYALGLMNVFEDSGEYSVRNSMILFSLSYVFPILDK
ncbi:MAG: porin family protein [Candidatus Zixiibacteriota bacterium]